MMSLIVIKCYVYLFAQVLCVPVCSHNYKFQFAHVVNITVCFRIKRKGVLINYQVCKTVVRLFILFHSRLNFNLSVIFSGFNILIIACTHLFSFFFLQYPLLQHDVSLSLHFRYFSLFWFFLAFQGLLRGENFCNVA